VIKEIFEIRDRWDGLDEDLVLKIPDILVDLERRLYISWGNKDGSPPER